MTSTPKIQFKVLTLNTWLLRTPIGLDLAKNVDKRAIEIPKRIAMTGADIVLLQEVWHPSLRLLFKKAFYKLGYKHSTVTDCDPTQIDRRSFLKKLAFSIPKGLKDISHEIMRGGMVIFSKFELKEKIDKLVFKSHTRPDEVYVEKGAIKTQVKLPKLGWADLYNAHSGAVTYDTKAKLFYPNEVESRKNQTVELAEWVNKTRNSDFVLLGADLNSHHHAFEKGKYQDKMSDEYALITLTPPYGAGLMDTYSLKNGREKIPGFTDENKNYYKTSGHFADSPDAVLDYVFVSSQKNLHTLESKVVFDEHCISDHYGVISTFGIS